MHANCKIFWFVDSNCIIHKIINIHPWSVLHNAKTNAMRGKSERGTSTVCYIGRPCCGAMAEFCFPTILFDWELRFSSRDLYILNFPRTNMENGVKCHCTSERNWLTPFIVSICNANMESKMNSGITLILDAALVQPKTARNMTKK